MDTNTEGEVVTLTEFLLARIDDDEERSKFVDNQQSEWDKANAFEEWRLSWQDEYNLLCIEPSRALAECEAKRDIIREHVPRSVRGMDTFCDADDWGMPCPTLRALVLPYADHPDYDESWRG